MSSDIKRYMPEHMAAASDALTQAIIKAINMNDESVAQLIQACIDQLFLSSANGKYLVQLGEQEGFTMPANSGLDIRAYRILVPLIVSAPKQIRRTIDEMLQAFYGTDRTKPSITATTPEPYVLASGDDIIVETESGRAALGILASQVSDVTNLTAGELAAVINTLQTLYTADVSVERGTNQRFLRLTSKAEGTSAYIKAVGGTMQNVLQFPFKRETAQEAGTTWNVTKEAIYTDTCRFTWDGLGTNPMCYLIQKGDTVTIRGLTDGVDLLSKLNGSYEIIDSGYDYFVIRAPLFADASAVVVQPEANSLFFTSSKPSILFNQPEYALSSETSYNAATITVPAIPPLARRFLAGSAHLHGYEGEVLSFTRASITVRFPAGLEKPLAQNAFVLSNRRNRYNFKQNYFRTFGRDDAPDPTFNVTVGDDTAFELPFTSPTLTGTDPIYARVGSEEYVVTTGARHGLYRGWGVTLAGLTPFGNITAPMINQEHAVTRVIDANKFVIRIKDANGNYVKFTGFQFGSFDVYRHNVSRPDQADFYLQFPTPGDVTTSGLQVDSIFRLDPLLGTNIDAYYGTNLRFRDLRVIAIDGSQVHIRAGFGPGSETLVISGTDGYRDGRFGGALSTYHFDQTTAYNQENVMAGLKACFMAATPQVNPNYIGSYIYDPTGAKTTVTVSRFIARTTSGILKGSNDNIVFVDAVKNVFNNEDFPSTGQVVIDYGTDKFEGPVRYIAVISSDSGPSQIILDPSYRFKNSHAAGAQIQYIHSVVPYAPGIDGDAFPFYLTGTAQARNTLFTLLELLIAAGVFLQADVLLPELRYQDPAIEPFS